MIGTVISAIAARLLTPNVLIGLGTIAGVGVLLTYVYFAGYGDGVEAERARNAAQDALTDTSHRRLILDVDDCENAGGEWNVSIGICR
ncbi:MAG: hypothetical protein ROR55_20085 [Devosia sp.]